MVLGSKDDTLDQKSKVVLSSSGHSNITFKSSHQQKVKAISSSMFDDLSTAMPSLLQDLSLQAVQQIITSHEIYAIMNQVEHFDDPVHKSIWLHWCPRQKQSCEMKRKNASFRFEIIHSSKLHEYILDDSYWPISSVSSIVKMLQIQYPNDDMFLAIVNHPNEQISQHDIIDLPNIINDIICVGYANLHYAVIRYNKKHEMITIYDGLASNDCAYNSNQWMGHAHYLQRKFTIGGMQLNISPNAVTVSNVMLKQVDGYNCGPIACMVVWKLISKMYQQT